MADPAAGVAFQAVVLNRFRMRMLASGGMECAMTLRPSCQVGQPGVCRPLGLGVRRKKCAASSD